MDSKLILTGDIKMLYVNSRKNYSTFSSKICTETFCSTHAPWQIFLFLFQLGRKIKLKNAGVSRALTSSRTPLAKTENVGKNLNFSPSRFSHFSALTLRLSKYRVWFPPSCTFLSQRIEPKSLAHHRIILWAAFPFCQQQLENVPTSLGISHTGVGLCLPNLCKPQAAVTSTADSDGNHCSAEAWMTTFLQFWKEHHCLATYSQKLHISALLEKAWKAPVCFMASLGWDFPSMGRQ